MDIKEHAKSELEELIEMIPKDLKSDDIVPMDVQNKMKERTEKLIKELERVV